MYARVAGARTAHGGIGSMVKVHDAYGAIATVLVLDAERSSALSSFFYRLMTGEIDLTDKLARNHVESLKRLAEEQWG